MGFVLVDGFTGVGKGLGIATFRFVVLALVLVPKEDLLDGDLLDEATLFG